MSNENQNASSGSSSNASGTDDQKVDKDGFYPKDFVEKLKKEKINARTEADLLKKTLQEREAQELEKAGKLNELVELERSRSKDLDEKNKNLSAMIIKKAVLVAVRSEAEKLGAQYFDVIEKMIDPARIDVNPETLEVDLNGIKNQIVGLKSSMPLLFKTEAPKTVDQSPLNFSSSNSQINKKLTDYTSDELKQLLKQKL